VVLVLVAGAVGYWLGSHRGMMFARPFGFGFSAFGFVGLLLLALLVAVIVGAIVSALTRDQTTTTETYEEWHRRAHAQDPSPVGPGEMTPAPPVVTPAAPVAPPPPPDMPPASPEDETVT
jgi:hypothetical protein